VFSSAEFATFCDDVRAAEERSLALSVSEAHATETECQLVAGMNLVL
jgi:hypothetical protein